MGQYYLICNVDKQEFLNPHKFGQGLKLREFGPAGDSIGYALIALLADGNGRGGGDLGWSDDAGPIGSWAGDRIVVAGDYADPKYTPLNDEEYFNLHAHAYRSYRDISDDIIRVIQTHDPLSELTFLDMRSPGWRVFRPKPDGEVSRNMCPDMVIYTK